MDIDTTLRDAVAGEVGQERFELWFGEGVHLRLTDGSLYVLAGEQFTLDRLRKQFHSDLQTACSEVTGLPVSIRYELEPSLVPSDAAPTVEASDEVKATEREETESNAPSRRFARLEDFVIGDGNRVAFTAAEMVAERAGPVSPVFLYGPPGTGKTHLLEGIWSAVRSGQSRRVLYLTAEQFTSMFLEALRGTGLPSFRHKYRHVDLLLIDDVQFFLGKRATLVELQNTMDALLRDRRQVVLAADRSPVELAKFGPVLTTRLSGGLVCNLEAPCVAIRREIVRKLTRRLAVRIPDDVQALIADRVDGDARRLAGALHRLEAASRAFQRPVDLDFAQISLLDVFRATSKAVQLTDIERAVCDVFGLDPSILQSAGKTRLVSQPRALAMWLARRHTRAAYSEIGAYFGRRSHSTVISAEKQVGRWLEDRESIRLAHGQCDITEAIRRVETQLRAG